MMDKPAKLAAYMARIGIDTPPACNADGLRQVQAAHRRHIPFENLDVRLGQPIVLDNQRLFEKLVHQGRGGFCFEHNGLFANMLEALGFAARLLLARVLLADPPAMPPRTHCLVLVDLGGQPWIADVGFGGSYAPPMPLVDGTEAQSGDLARHRLRRIGPDGMLPGGWLLERRGPRLATDGRARSDTQWEAQYAFDLAAVAASDLALGCHWAATHPQSRFTNALIVSRCLPDGFISLIDRALTIYRAGRDVERHALPDAETMRAALEEQFGLAVSLAQAAALPPQAR